MSIISSSPEKFETLETPQKSETRLSSRTRVILLLASLTTDLSSEPKSKSQKLCLRPREKKMSSETSSTWSREDYEASSYHSSKYFSHSKIMLSLVASI